MAKPEKSRSRAESAPCASLFRVSGPEKIMKLHVVPFFSNSDLLLLILSLAKIAIVFLLVASCLTALSFLPAGDGCLVTSFGSQGE